MFGMQIRIDDESAGAICSNFVVRNFLSVEIRRYLHIVVLHKTSIGYTKELFIIVVAKRN